jgi:thymidine phosphorylase
VLAVLQGASDAPSDLRERAVRLAGTVLSLAGGVTARQGARTARRLLDSGEAWRKFCAICEAQGGLKDPPRAPVTREILATTTGKIVRFDNRALARAAKLAGAPRSPAAGLDLKVRLGDVVERGQPLFVLHAQHRGELEYATQNLPRLGTPIVVEPT